LSIKGKNEKSKESFFLFFSSQLMAKNKADSSTWSKISNEAYEKLKKEKAALKSNELIKVKNIFAYSTKYCQRSNEDYHNDVETTLTEGCSSRGVKGP
jgi:hypothetical protein